jgi:hypothetical protein
MTMDGRRIIVLARYTNRPVLPPRAVASRKGRPVTLLPPEYWLHEHDSRRDELMRKIAARRVQGEATPPRRRAWARKPRPAKPIAPAVPCTVAPC